VELFPFTGLEPQHADEMAHYLTPITDKRWFARIGHVFQISENRHGCQKYEPFSRYDNKTLINRGCSTMPLQIQELKDSACYMNLKLNSVALVRKQTIPTERPPHVCEVSANVCG
jgi:hypothetical protein